MTIDEEQVRLLVVSFKQKADNNQRKADYRSDDELQALYDGIRIGRERSAAELEKVLEDDS